MIDGPITTTMAVMRCRILAMCIAGSSAIGCSGVFVESGPPQTTASGFDLGAVKTCGYMRFWRKFWGATQAGSAALAAGGGVTTTAGQTSSDDGTRKNSAVVGGVIAVSAGVATGIATYLHTEYSKDYDTFRCAEVLRPNPIVEPDSSTPHANSHPTSTAPAQSNITPAHSAQQTLIAAPP